MNRTILLTVVACAIGGRWPVPASADEYLAPPPVQTADPALQSVFPVPPPVLVDSPLPAAPLMPAPAGHPPIDTNCMPCDPPQACVRGPFSRLWHCHTKPHLQASHWGYPDFFHERPFGSYMRSAAASQIENGLAAQMVLYHHDFVLPDGRPGVELNTRGAARLQRLLPLISHMPGPLVIELDERNPAMSAARRDYVLGQLRQLAPEVTDDRVAVARPIARGLAGTEAVAIQTNVQQQVQYGAMQSFSGGVNAGISPGATGASGASGASITPGTGF